MSGRTLVIEYKEQMHCAAYKGDSSIEGVIILASVEKIDSDAFAECVNLRSVTIQNGIKYIDSRAFRGCTSLTELHIPVSVRTIDGEAFGECTSLRSVKLDEGITEIDWYDRITKKYVFPGCTSITELTIPSTVTNINFYSFSTFPNLAAIHVAKGNKFYSDKNGVLYDREGKMLLYVPNGYSGYLGIPEGVLVLYIDAFSNCDRLTSVSIPASVKDLTSLYDNYGTLYSPSYSQFLRAKNDEDYRGYFGYPFGSCTSLESVSVAQGNPIMRSSDGALYFIKYMNNSPYYELVCYPLGKKGSYTLPVFAEYISDYYCILNNCPNLTELTIPFGTNLKEIHCRQRECSCLAFLKKSHIKTLNIDESWKGTDHVEDYLASLPIDVHYIENKAYQAEIRKKQRIDNIQTIKMIVKSLLILGILVLGAVKLLGAFVAGTLGMKIFLGSLAILVIIIIIAL